MTPAAKTTAERWRHSRASVFRSVFGHHVGLSPPPPGSGRAAALDSGRRVLHPAALTDQVRWDRAWHRVTSVLALPPSLAAEDSFSTTVPSQSQSGGPFSFYSIQSSPDVSRDLCLPASPPPPPQRAREPIDAAVDDALRIVLYPARHVPGASRTQDLTGWLSAHILGHVVQHVVPLLSACESTQDARQLLIGSLCTLEAAHRQYRRLPVIVSRGLDAGDRPNRLSSVARDLRALVQNTTSPAFFHAATVVLDRLMRVALGLVNDPGLGRDLARSQLLGMCASMARVGLFSEKLVNLCTERLSMILSDYVHVSCARSWASPTSPPSSYEPRKLQNSQAGGIYPPSLSSLLPSSSQSSACVAELDSWVVYQYSRLAADILISLGASPPAMVLADVQRHRGAALELLASLRIVELFDIILQWPHSRSGLTDLMLTVTSPHSRLVLTDTLSAALRGRLLHPGRSTLEILRMYMSLIRAFHALEPSKVLLDRVVRSLQLYLCHRDDAIRIVVTGLLANPASGSGDSRDDSQLAELAALLNKHFDGHQGQQQHSPQQQQFIPTDRDGDIPDWHDMDWEPDPIDAGANYRRPKSEDIIGTLVDALGSKDVFIKEFQSIMAERLLSPTHRLNSADDDGGGGLGQESRVLLLLERRFGEGALQNCDVMMRDLQDSYRLHAVISVPDGAPQQQQEKQAEKAEEAQESEAATVEPHRPVYHAKILSRLYWPTMSACPLTIPEPVSEAQVRYEKDYRVAKSGRRLTWYDQRATATVRLELADRVVEVHCPAVEATVIYAFGHPVVQLSIDEVAERLGRPDGDVVEAALSAWIGRGVLRHNGAGVFAVVEQADSSLSSTTAGLPAPSAYRTGAVGPVRQPGQPEGGEQTERRRMYWQFIVSMLTNSSPAMPLAQVAMVMGMLVPDGFAWGMEELAEFLMAKVEAGELEFAGGKYRLPGKK